MKNKKVIRVTDNQKIRVTAFKRLGRRLIADKTIFVIAIIWVVLVAFYIVLAATSCAPIMDVEQSVKDKVVEETRCTESSVLIVGKEQATFYTDYFLSSCKDHVTVRVFADGSFRIVYITTNNR